MREILTTSAFVFAASAVSSSIASLVLFDAGAVGTLILWAFGWLRWAVGFVAVVDAISVSIANIFGLNAEALTEMLVRVAFY